MKPKCFVAMRFGIADVDAIYERTIGPSIEAAGFSSRVVNRINHNDDIDDRIFKELDECRMCVADLTYARPSVYYEAGYARARGVPVVHTVRKDHFKSSNPEDQRVHFDLQMKNIIGWSSPADAAFAKRLKERLELVARPVLRKLVADKELSRERSQFAEASIELRMDYLQKVLGGELLQRGYREIVRPDPDERVFLLAGLSSTGAVFAKRVGAYDHIVNLIFRYNLRYSEIGQQLRKDMIPDGFGGRRFSHLTVYVCMNRLSKVALERKLARFNQDTSAKRFRKRYDGQGNKRGELPRYIHEIAFIDSPASASDALETFGAILEGSVFDAKRLLPVYKEEMT